MFLPNVLGNFKYASMCTISCFGGEKKQNNYELCFEKEKWQTINHKGVAFPFFGNLSSFNLVKTIITSKQF